MPKKAQSQTLEARSTYILPTAYGIFFAVILYCMLMGSINYNNSMGFLLTFLLTAISLIGMIFTYRNIIGVKVSAGTVKPVFAGDTAEFLILAETTDKKPAFQIGINEKHGRKYMANVTSNKLRTFTVKKKTTKRGYLSLDRLRVWSIFPLGLFHAWAWVSIDSKVLVYPKPSGAHVPLLSSNIGMGQKKSHSSYDDDFTGVRRYQSSDSPNRIAWKAYARGDEVLTKQFAGASDDEIWLDWYALKGLSTEEKLSQLCQWVLDLYLQNYSYGLRMPGGNVAPSNGEFHKLQCLEKLALFNNHG